MSIGELFDESDVRRAEHVGGGRGGGVVGLVTDDRHVGKRVVERVELIDEIAHGAHCCASG